MNLVERLFGSHSDHELKLIQPKIDKILALRETMVAMSDEDLKAQTQKFKDRLSQGETLDDILPEAFATVREAARRVLGLTAYLISDFIPTVYFSFFMGALLITAHLASYVILPAILVLPTGELFLKPIRRRERALREEEELVARRADAPTTND